MDRIRRTFRSKPTYAPINADTRDDESESYNGSNESLPPNDTAFSWIEYSIFTLLGVAMLWAWYGLLSSERQSFPMLTLLLSQEHVSRGRALLCPPVPLRPMAARALPVRGDLSRMLHELDLHDMAVQAPEERIVSAPYNPLAIHLHDLLCPPLHLDAL